MTEPEHIVPLVPVRPGTPPDAQGGPSPKPAPRSPAGQPSPLVRTGVVAGTAALVLVAAVAAMGASPAPTGSTTTPTTPSASVDPNAGRPGPDWLGGVAGRGDVRGMGRGFGSINVTAVNGSSLSLATDDGWTRTISATSSTTITKGGATIAIGDIAVGDQIRFSQTKSADGTYQITAIAVVLPSVGGQVTAKTADTITVTQRDGTSATIHVSSSTTYLVQGVDAASLADISVGMGVRAAGTQRSDGSIDASSVMAGKDGPRGRGPGHHGDDGDADDAPTPTATPG